VSVERRVMDIRERNAVRHHRLAELLVLVRHDVAASSSSGSGEPVRARSDRAVNTTASDVGIAIVGQAGCPGWLVVSISIKLAGMPSDGRAPIR
jgi:hypothetical protein